MSGTSSGSGGSPRLAARLWLARAVLFWERAWIAVWPAVGIAGLFLAIALFDVLPLLPGWLHLAILAAFAAAFLWTLGHAVSRFRSPRGAEAQRRLELASALPHRPLTAVNDRLAAGGADPYAAALWQLHQRRMAEAIRRLRVGVPRPGLAKRDPIALRAALVLVLTVAVVTGWAGFGDRVGRALSPGLGMGAARVATLRLWITPPEYTGRPPLFPSEASANKPGEAKAGAQPPLLSVPAGSVLTAQVQGGYGQPELEIDGSRTTFQRIDDGVYKAGATLTAGETLAVRQGGNTLGRWRLKVVPDRPPTVAIDPPPAATPQGTLRLAYKAKDDYGIAKVAATIRLQKPNGSATEAKPMTLDLALPKLNAPAVSDVTYHDLTTNPWAGLPAFVRLTATDTAGQTGESKEVAFTIPERVFHNPVAKRIIAERKKLALRGDDARLEVIAGIEDIAARPGAYDGDPVVFLSLISARSRLHYDPDGTAISSVEKLLWDTALRLEDGKLSISQRDMREIEKKLMDALANNAPDSEIQRLMSELQQALSKFLQALAEQMAKQQPNQNQMAQLPPNAQVIEGQDLMRMLQRAQELMRMGSRDAAREMLAQLRNILENMQNGSMMSMQQMQNSPAGQAMRQLQDMIRRQNQLLNKSFQAQQQGAKPGEMQMSASEQQALRQALDKLRQQLQKMGQGMPGKAGDQLGKAGQAMGEAAGSLGRGDPSGAIGPQTQALQALQQAGQGMMQQMMSQMGYGPGYGPYGPNMMNPNQRLQGMRDPLGRPLPEEQHGFDASDVKIPSESDVQRAKHIVDELRRRAGERNRTALELDYIQRLLDQF